MKKKRQKHKKTQPYKQRETKTQEQIKTCSRQGGTDNTKQSNRSSWQFSYPVPSFKGQVIQPAF
jgi:hypothetical protein